MSMSFISIPRVSGSSELEMSEPARRALGADEDRMNDQCFVCVCFVCE